MDPGWQFPDSFRERVRANLHDAEPSRVQAAIRKVRRRKGSEPHLLPTTDAERSAGGEGAADGEPAAGPPPTIVRRPGSSGPEI
jgi:hypothetical protein